MSSRPKKTISAETTTSEASAIIPTSGAHHIQSIIDGLPSDEQKLIACQALSDRAPYNIMGYDIPGTAQKIARGECISYRLLVPGAEAGKCETLLGLIETFCSRGFRGAKWDGLGNSIPEKIAARQTIDSYRQYFIERIGYIEGDAELGNDDGSEIESEIQLLFPELSFANVGDDIQITYHHPSGYMFLGGSTNQSILGSIL